MLCDLKSPHNVFQKGSYPLLLLHLLIEHPRQLETLGYHKQWLYRELLMCVAKLKGYDAAELTVMRLEQPSVVKPWIETLWESLSLETCQHTMLQWTIEDAKELKDYMDGIRKKKTEEAELIR